jgi:hypothetical protein
MNFFRGFILAGTVALASACASVSTVPLTTSAKTEGSFPATSPSQVEIYRKNRIEGQYQEIGIITLISGSNNILYIHNRMREEAGKKGATHILNFKLISEIRPVSNTTTSCQPNGGCTSATSTTYQKIYTASGTLVRGNL